MKTWGKVMPFRKKQQMPKDMKVHTEGSGTSWRPKRQAPFKPVWPKGSNRLAGAEDAHQPLTFHATRSLLHNLIFSSPLGFTR